MGLEEELKYRLQDETALERIARILGPPTCETVQHNVYFDTPGLKLHRSGILLRLRREEGKPGGILTLKKAVVLQPGRIVAEEQERNLSARRVQELLEKPSEVLQSLDLSLAAAVLEELHGAALQRAGDLITHRRSYELPEGELALDLVKFPDGSECEVELETEHAQQGRRFLERLFESAGVTAFPEGEPKSGRLFKRLGLLGRGADVEPGGSEGLR